MILLYLNGVDRTADVTQNTIRKTNQIQQRADILEFDIYQGTKPTENQDVKLYFGDTIFSIAGDTIVLNGYFEKSVSRFYGGQSIFLNIGSGAEIAATVKTYDEATLTIVLTAAPTGVVAGSKIGELIFGGTTSRIKDKNIDVLQNLEWGVTCVDYSKIFDKKLIADTWANVDCRYIINDFCNTTVNYNTDVDNMSYPNNAAISAAWIKSLDGNNPTIDSADYLEQTNSGIFPWTFSTGTAKWDLAPTTKNIAIFTGLNSGTPTKGIFMLWLKPTDYTKITSIKVRLGSTSANYVEVTIPLPTSNSWQYQNVNLKNGAVTGTPDWTNFHYAQIIITQTASSSIKFNGFRINADNSFTLYNTTSTITFTSYKSSNLKPTALMQALAKAISFVWWIDGNRDIHFVGNQTQTAPYSLTDTSNNFTDLKIDVDQSQLGNRVIIQGGEIDSASRYSQVIPGDNAKKEWILKNKFSSLVITIDDGTSTHAAAAGTTTTNIKIVGHGLATGDHVINRTRSNAVREITRVDADNFTVQTVTAQTTADNITFFAATKTSGIEGIVDESTVDYVTNFERQSVRASTQTATLPATSFIKFNYLEKISIQVQYTDPASANGLKALGIGDGIFDLLPIVDRSIADLYTAVSLAQAQINDYRNPIINGTFTTDVNGLAAGQVIQITDSVRGITNNYLIQIVRSAQKDGEFSDYFIYNITFGTTLFGIIEFYQKLLAMQGNINDNVDEIVETFVTSIEDISMHAAGLAAKDGGFKSAKQSETVGVSKTEVGYKNAKGMWKWETSVGQNLQTRWNLFDWSNVIDYYPEANYSAAYQMSNAGGAIGCGQTFTGDGQNITKCRWYLGKNGSPTALFVAKIYAHTGTWGSGGLPIGAALATSDSVSATVVTSALGLVDFNFTGINQITLTNGVHYVLTIEYLSGTVPDGSNNLNFGADSTAPTHNGNAVVSLWSGGGWFTTGRDGIFYAFGNT